MAATPQEHLEIQRLVMGMDPEEYDPTATPPKISLSKLPNKPIRAAMPTPPSKLSIPFHWEEAPGKARPQSFKNSSSRRLELPPRMALINNVNSSSSSSLSSSAADSNSPTTVLGGPDERAVSSCASHRSLEEAIIGDDDEYEDDGVINKEKTRFTCKFSRSFGSSSKGSRRFIRRRSSFSSLSHASSKFLAGVYGSFRQVVQWRRRQEQLKTADLI